MHNRRFANNKIIIKRTVQLYKFFYHSIWFLTIHSHQTKTIHLHSQFLLVRLKAIFTFNRQMFIMLATVAQPIFIVWASISLMGNFSHCSIERCFRELVLLAPSARWLHRAATQFEKTTDRFQEWLNLQDAINKHEHEFVLNGKL